MSTVSKDVYKDATERILRYLVVNKNWPNYVTVNDEKVLKDSYEDAIKRTDAFIKTNKTFPKTVRMDACKFVPATPTIDSNGWVEESQYTWSEQDTAYWCLPASMVETLSSMGITESESHIAKLAGTTKNGTDHAGIRQAVKSLSSELGITLTYDEQYLSDIGLEGISKVIADPNAGIIAHGKTGKGYWQYDYTGKLIWTNTYGHYCGVKSVNISKSLIKLADPTKGFVTYTLAEFAKGINGILGQKSIITIRRK